MQNFIQSLKKVMQTYGFTIALVIGFSAGVFTNATGFFSKFQGNNMSASIAASVPSVTGTEAVTGGVCGLTQMPGNNDVRGIFVSASDFDAATQAYQKAHPDMPAGTATWGGIIGKEYLMALINSTPANQTNVRFCYAREANGKTSIYFKGGALDPISGKVVANALVLKTGTSVDAYCPTHCQDN